MFTERPPVELPGGNSLRNPGDSEMKMERYRTARVGLQQGDCLARFEIPPDADFLSRLHMPVHRVRNSTVPGELLMPDIDRPVEKIPVHLHDRS